MSAPELVQTSEGRAVAHKGKSILVDRYWDVMLDGEKIGQIRYTMMTRERKTPGRGYVDTRWSSPGWQWKSIDDGQRFFSWHESVSRSKKGCIDALVHHHEWRRRHG